MNECTRFENEGLEVDMLSAEFTQHLQGCKPCQQAQSSYEKLASLLRQCQAPAALPLGWKEKVWCAIQAQEKQKLAPSWWERWCMAIRAYRWALGGLATATVLAVVFVSLELHHSVSQESVLKTPFSQTAAFSWSIYDSSASSFRNTEGAKVGNEIHVNAHIPPSSQVALFVYVHEQLVFSCSSSAPGPHCQHAENTLKAQIPLEKIGLYRALWVVSAEPLSVSGKNFDADAASLLHRGANIQHPFVLEVY
ncbi:MAG: hypothetical protein FWG75_03425 [Cystobacterineae bacterium]|nr:hypothetical protein [Cystobacterineae bacterium]